METRMLLRVGVFVLGISGLAAAEQLDVPGQYPTIQAAIDAARAGDTVVVADGVYTGPGNRDIRFLGKAITVRSENGPVNCIIDCQGTQQDPHRGFDFDGGETAETVLDGFTITNGSTPPGAILDEFNGAGILFRDGSPTVKNCIITNNWAGCWGGAMCCSWFGNSSPTIINCTIADNYSNAEGGALFTLNNSPTIIGSLIVNNEAAALGGGINHFGGGTVTIINTTIAGNVAPTASGIYGSNVDISNSIVWGNVGSNEQIWGATVSYSDVQGGFDGEGNINADPLFVDPQNGDLHLSPGSPCIDAADNTAAPKGTDTDLDGEPRFIDDPCTDDTGNGAAPVVDMGVYEFQGSSCDLDGDGSVGVKDLLILLGNWGPCGDCNDCPADLDADCSVGVKDLLILLGNWG